MYGIDENTNYEKRNVAKPQGSSWAIYKRLLGYVFEYRMRMAVSIVLALFVAVSLGGIIVLSGKVVMYTFDTDENARAELTKDAGKISKLTKDMREIVGWAPTSLDDRLHNLVRYLREEDQETRAMVWLCSIILVLGFDRRSVAI